MELFSPGHLIPLLLIAGILFFGWKQLPDMARSAGRSLRIFRTEIKGLADDDAARATRDAVSAPFAGEPAPPVSPMTVPPVTPASGSIEGPAGSAGAAGPTGPGTGTSAG